MKGLEKEGSHQREQQIVGLRSKEVWSGHREKGRIVGGDISMGAKIRQRPDHRPLGMKRAFLFLCRQREFCERFLCTRRI